MRTQETNEMRNDAGNINSFSLKKKFPAHIKPQISTLQMIDCLVELKFIVKYKIFQCSILLIYHSILIQANSYRNKL